MKERLCGKWKNAFRLTLVVITCLATVVLIPNVAYGNTATDLSGPSATPLRFPTVRVAKLAPSTSQMGLINHGFVSKSKSISVDFTFAYNNISKLDSLLADLYNPHSSMFHHWLTPSRFESLYGPTPTQLGELNSWLKGSHIVERSISGEIVHTKGTIGQYAGLLGVHFHRLLAGNGASYYSTLQAPTVPIGLTNEIVAVTGLDNVVHLKPQIKPALTSHYQSPESIGATYGVSNINNEGFTGKGETIALYELAAYSQSDVVSFEQLHGYSNSVQAVNVDGGAAYDYSTGGTEEADLDVEDALAQAPGANILVYQGPQSGTGPTDIYNQIVQDDKANVISSSWGACESDYAPSDFSVYHQIFQQAAAQGQANFAAAGDSGSEDCFATDGTTELAVDYPGSDPLVTDVGGTSLGTTETVWNDCLNTASVTCANNGGGAGGGGMSQQWSEPSWQMNFDSNTWSSYGNVCGIQCRGVPDVSADADPSTGYEIIYDGSSAVVGGTSAASPLVTGIAADVDQSCTTPTGNFSPALYGLAGTSSGYSTSFNDIVSGNNDLTNTNQGDFQASTGYDLASGLGSPKANGWICPQISSISPTSGVTGDKVTLTGLNLGQATVYFGTVPAPILSASSTQLIVTAPVGSSTVSVSSSNPVGTGRESATFTYSNGSGSGGSSGGGGGSNSQGYLMLNSGGTVFNFGNAINYGSASYSDVQGGAISLADAFNGTGYWITSANGTVDSFGSAHSYPISTVPSSPVVSIVATPDSKGYWLASQTGQIVTGGDAQFYGSMGGKPLNKPIVGMQATADGKGYWLVASDGGIFSYGDAQFYGSMGGKPLNKPIVGMAATPDGKGYWLVASDGGIFSFGDAEFYGSKGGSYYSSGVVAIEAS